MQRKSFFVHKIFVRHSAGFLLIEFLIALAIFSIFAFSMLGLQSTLVRAYDLAHKKIQILSLLIDSVENPERLSTDDAIDQVVSFYPLLPELESMMAKNKKIHLCEIPIRSIIINKKSLIGSCAMRISHVTQTVRLKKIS